MHVLNLSAEPLGKLYSWLPHDLTAESVVFLPDACPGKSPLPTGTVIQTRQPDWRRFAVSDCGCGMRLVRSALRPEELTSGAWDRLADALRRQKGGLGDLGGGNHFLDALAPYDGERLHLLIHTGSRMESGHVDALVDQPEAFDREFTRIVDSGPRRTGPRCSPWPGRSWGRWSWCWTCPTTPMKLCPTAGP